MHMSTAVSGGQKKLLQGPVEFKLQGVVNSPMFVLAEKLRSSARAVCALNCWAIFLAHLLFFLIYTAFLILQSTYRIV